MNIFNYKFINKLNFIEQILYNWKLNNISSSIDDLNYMNDNIITFKISILNNDINFVLTLVELNHKWILDLSSNIDNDIKKYIIYKINNINNEYSNMLLNDLNILLDIIELNFKNLSDLDDYLHKDTNSKNKNINLNLNNKKFLLLKITNKYK